MQIYHWSIVATFSGRRGIALLEGSREGNDGLTRENGTLSYPARRELFE